MRLAQHTNISHYFVAIFRRAFLFHFLVSTSDDFGVVICIASRASQLSKPIKEDSAFTWYRLQTIHLANRKMNEEVVASDEMILVALVL